MERASLIISHAGAGCILEALSLRKPLVVVVNEGLMDNHQAQLAHELEREGHVLCATPDSLEAVLARVPGHTWRPFARGQGTQALRKLVRNLLMDAEG